MSSPHFCNHAKVGAFVLEMMTAFWLPGAHAGTAISIGFDKQAGIAYLPGRGAGWN